MTDEKRHDELTEEELKAANGEPLPDREVMSTIGVGEPFVAPDPGITLPVEPPGGA